MILSIFRFADLLFSLVVVIFNVSLIFYFYKMSLFYINLLNQNGLINKRMAGIMVTFVLIFMIFSIVSDNLYQTLQYALHGIVHFTSDDQKEYETAQQILFNDYSLTIYRVIYFIKDQAAFVVSCFLCIMVRYFADSSGTEGQDDGSFQYTTQNSLNSYLLETPTVRGSIKTIVEKINNEITSMYSRRSNSRLNVPGEEMRSE